MKKVQFNRELSDELAEFIASKAKVCGGGAFDIWEAICSRFGQPAEQHQGEPVAHQVRDYLTTAAARQNLELSTDRDIYKAEVDRLLPEINRLRDQLAELKEAFNESQDGLVLRGKMVAERDALLRAWLDMFAGGLKASPLELLESRTLAALSASAEPNTCQRCAGTGIWYPATGSNERQQCPEGCAPAKRDDEYDYRTDLAAYFGLSYASWLTLPRVLMEAMPKSWQTAMATLLHQYNVAYPNQPDFGTTVRVTKNGKIVRTPEWLVNYRHPDRAMLGQLRNTPGSSQQAEQSIAEQPPALYPRCTILKKTEVRYAAGTEGKIK